MSLLPPVSELPAAPRRIICHWTAGSREASAHDRERYHVLVEHWGDKYRYQEGVPVGRNMRSLQGVPAFHNNAAIGYAAHTRGFNSFSIGIALCGMREAVDQRPDGPVQVGSAPITTKQVEGLVKLVAHACRLYNLEPVPDDVFTHWEAEHIHGREQAGKWDITWLPDFEGPKRSYGPELRRRIVAEMRAQGGPPEGA